MTTKQIVFRGTEQMVAIWHRLAQLRGMPTGNAAWADLLNRLDESAQSKLEGEALEKYLAGELTRAEWGRACVSYQLRKKAAAAVPA